MRAMRAMRAATRRFLRSRRGNAAIEFAFVVPVMLSAAAGIVDLGGMFKVYNGVNRVATQYASAWADCSDFPAGTCLTELGTYTPSAAISNIAPQLVPANITALQMFQVTMNGTNPVVTYSYPAAGTLTAAQITAARASLSSGQVGVLVTLSYQHSLQFFASLMTPILGSYLNQSFTVVQLKS